MEIADVAPGHMRATTQQVLVGLAGISGAVLIAALVPQFGNRPRRSLPLAMFESIIVAVILISAMLTAQGSLVALFGHQEISSQTMSQLAWPLAFSVVLLIILAMTSRLAPATRSPLTMAPVLLSIVYLAAAAGLAIDENLSSGQLWDFVIGVLLSSGLIALGMWWLESMIGRRSVRARRVEIAQRWQGSRVIEERLLRVGVPGAVGSGLTVGCWSEDGRVFLDGIAARRFQRQINERWDTALDRGAALPLSTPIATDARVLTPWIPPWRERFEVQLQRPGSKKPELLTVDAHGGYFDITDLNLV